MSQIHPVQILLDEHRVIEGVLNAFEKKLSAVSTDAFPVQWLDDAMDFFRTFVEGCHHNREEDVVFAQWRESGVIEQHLSGAPYLDRLEATLSAARGGEPRAIEALCHDGLAYVTFLREHIRQEDAVLIWAATQPATDRDILVMQEDAGSQRFHGMDEETYDLYLALADKLCGSGRSAPLARAS